MDQANSDDFVFPWDSVASRTAGTSGGSGAGSSTQSAAAAGMVYSRKTRRSSILKPPPPMTMATASEAFVSIAPGDQNFEGRPALKDIDINTAKAKLNADMLEKRNRRRSLKRVSFSSSKQIKEFHAGSETLTVWNSTYEEEHHVNASSSAANPSSGSLFSSTKESETVSSRKRSADLTEYPDVSPSKKMPLEIGIPSIIMTESHQFLPSFHEEGNSDLLLVGNQASVGDNDGESIAIRSQNFLQTLTSNSEALDTTEEITISLPREGLVGKSDFLKELEKINKATTEETAASRWALSDGSARNFVLEQSVGKMDTTTMGETECLSTCLTKVQEKTIIFNLTGKSSDGAMDLTLEQSLDKRNTTMEETECISSYLTRVPEKTIIFNQTGKIGGAMDITLEQSVEKMNATAMEETECLSYHLTKVFNQAEKPSDGGAQDASLDKRNTTMEETECISSYPTRVPEKTIIFNETGKTGGAMDITLEQSVEKMNTTAMEETECLSSYLTKGQDNSIVFNQAEKPSDGGEQGTSLEQSVGREVVRTFSTLDANCQTHSPSMQTVKISIPTTLSVFHHISASASQTPEWQRGHGRWDLESATDWKAQFSFMHKSLLLNISLGFPISSVTQAEEDCIVKHWKIRSIEFQNPSPLQKYHPSNKVAVLAHRLLLKQLPPSVLEKWCASTLELPALLEKIQGIVATAAKFVSYLSDIDSTHFFFQVKDLKVTIGFNSCILRTDFFVSVLLSPDMEEAPKAIEVVPGVGTISQESILKLSQQSSTGWDFLKLFVTKVDLYIHDLEVEHKLRKS